MSVAVVGRFFFSQNDLHSAIKLKKRKKEYFTALTIGYWFSIFQNISSKVNKLFKIYMKIVSSVN